MMKLFFFNTKAYVKKMEWFSVKLVYAVNQLLLIMRNLKESSSK